LTLLRMHKLLRVEASMGLDNELKKITEVKTYKRVDTIREEEN